jgi:hypothetical protein
MKNGFTKATAATALNGAAAPLSEAEQALKDWSIAYRKQPDGSLLVPGNLEISGMGLTRLPNLSSVSVGGGFSCANNQLTSLEHAPQTVGGKFWCDNNRLTSLEGAPQTVGGFSCSNNQLTSLEHAPATVGDGFSCTCNRLTSLEHAPASVGGSFRCSNNPLTSLEGAPMTFTSLKSDFGEFSSWDAVPENLRMSPETRARLEQKRLAEEAARQAAADKAIHAATVLQTPIAVTGPLRFKRPVFPA